MNILTTYKQNKETTKMVREFNTRLVKDALDELNTGECSKEQRDQLVDSTKRLLDTNAELEEAHSEYEFSAGMLTGVVASGVAVVAGAVLGKVIEYITTKYTK